MLFSILLLAGLYIHQVRPIPDANTIIDRSIEYHDPYNKWNNLQAHINFIETRPKGETRQSSVEVDNKNGIFCISREMDKMHVQRHIVKDTCIYNIDEYEELTDKEIEHYKLNNEYTFILRNYYLYLWGLPMKLRDKGATTKNEVKQVPFNGRQAYEVSVSYDQEVGSDLWFFYFNVDSYALLGYKFYHDNGKGDGEYVTLKDYELVFGINIPKTRSWYAAKDSTFLGTDALSTFDIISHNHQ